MASTDEASRSPTYAAEIREYLVGRYGRSGPITPRSEWLPPPVVDWWMLEGKSYQGLTGPLCDNWRLLARQVRAMLSTFNPRLRVLDVPDGIVDWTRTVQHNVGTLQRQYVCHASHVGLNEEEAQALRGWCAWITTRWTAYSANMHLDPMAGAVDALRQYGIGAVMNPTIAATPKLLRRWAHTSRRSRWPLLRNIVAESLRCAFDPQELDQIPLPLDTPTLFELVCLIRILRCIEPSPRSIRWLLLELGNEIRTPGAQCTFQARLAREDVLRHFDAPMRDGVLRHGVTGLHLQPDVVVRFDTPRAGFAGIIVEAKSGAQEFGATLAQLQTYHAVLRERHGGRWLVWGVIESRPDGTAITEQQLTAIRGAAGAVGGAAGDSMWVFSTADEIAPVLAAVGLTAAAEMIAAGQTADEAGHVVAHEEAKRRLAAAIATGGWP